MGYGTTGALRKAAVILAVASWGFTATAQPVTIAALGDSLTQGYGLVPEDGFVPQLQKWLQSHGADVVIINAGVSGDTTAGGAARAAWTLTPEVDAMIVTLGGNDLLRGIEPGVSRANLTQIMQAAQSAKVEVLLVGMRAPGNYGPEYKAEFEAIYPELAREFDSLLAENFFAGIAKSETDPAALRPFMQPDGIHPNADGVARIVEALGPRVLELIERVDERSDSS